MSAVGLQDPEAPLFWLVWFSNCIFYFLRLHLGFCLLSLTLLLNFWFRLDDLTPTSRSLYCSELWHLLLLQMPQARFPKSAGDWNPNSFLPLPDLTKLGIWLFPNFTKLYESRASPLYSRHNKRPMEGRRGSFQRNPRVKILVEPMTPACFLGL